MRCILKGLRRNRLFWSPGPPCAAAADRSCLQRGLGSPQQTLGEQTGVLAPERWWRCWLGRVPSIPGEAGVGPAGVSGLFLVLAMSVRGSGVPLTARERHCRHRAGAAPATGPHQRGDARLWGHAGRDGHRGQSPLRPAVLPARRLAVGRAGAVWDSIFPTLCLHFPICGRK